MKHERLTEGKFYHIYNRGINRSNLFVEPTEYEHFLWLYDKYISPVAETLAWVLMPNHFHFVVRIKENMVYKYSKQDQLNAVRSNDADRFEETADLSASAGWRTDNVKKDKQKRQSDYKSWFEEHKWETVELSSADFSEEVKKPGPHRHFGHLFNAYACYLNNRTGRTGNLFERPFKRKPIHNESYLKQVILYVHNNPVHHGFCNHLLEYPWSSYITCISEKPTKLERGGVLNLFNERDNFRKQHNQEIDIKKIEKYLELDVVDYTTKISDFNAVRSNDAVRFKTAATAADLSACAAPDNVKQDTAQDTAQVPRKLGDRLGDNQKKIIVTDNVEKDNNKKGINSFNADRSTDAVRIRKVATAADLSACAAPDNVKKMNKNKKETNSFNAVRSNDADRFGEVSNSSVNVEKGKKMKQQLKT